MKNDGYDDKRIRYFIGGVRDQEGLRRTFMTWTWRTHATDQNKPPDYQLRQVQAFIGSNREWL